MATDATPAPKLRSFQFRLLTLLVFVALCASACGWFWLKMQQTELQQQAVAPNKEFDETVQPSPVNKTEPTTSLVFELREMEWGFNDSSYCFYEVRARSGDDIGKICFGSACKQCMPFVIERIVDKQCVTIRVRPWFCCTLSSDNNIWFPNMSKWQTRTEGQIVTLRVTV